VEQPSSKEVESKADDVETKVADKKVVKKTAVTKKITPQKQPEVPRDSTRMGLTSAWALSETLKPGLYINARSPPTNAGVGLINKRSNIRMFSIIVEFNLFGLICELT